MGTIINLRADDYYTQRNNRVVKDDETGLRVGPSAACMPTSRVMFYRANKIVYKSKPGVPDDEYFTQLLLTKDAVAFARKKYPWLSQYPPNEIHGMYGSYLDEIVVGSRVSDFVNNLTWESVIARIEKGQAIMTSGRFSGVSTMIDGHAFCFVGYDGENLLLADPYGDHRTRYVCNRGYLVPMSKEEFEGYVKPLKNDGLPTEIKWGHVLL